MHNMLGLITLFYFIFLSIGVPQARAVTGCEGAALLEPQGSYSGSFANKPFKWRQNSATWVMVQIFSGTTQNYVFQTWYEAATICDGTTCSVTPGKNFLPGDYYWWLNTYSDTCNFQMQVGGIFLSFTIAVDPCTNPALSAPSGTVLTISPSFKFSKTLAQWVNLQIFYQASGKIAYSQWFDAAQVCTATGCTIQPTTQLAPGSYVWWLNTYSDTCGYRYKPDGTAVAFTVESCSNTPMTLTAPAEGSLQTIRPTCTWKKAGNFDYYQFNTFSISTNTISFRKLYSTADICTTDTCTVTIPGTTALPQGDTYWWLNASSPTCGFVSQPGGNLGYFKVVPASSKEITSFVLKQANNPGLTADMAGTITGNTIAVLVPATANMSALVPTITTIVGSSVNPPSGSAQAFTNGVPKTYTVTALDGSTINYAVTATVMTLTLISPLAGALQTQNPTFTWEKKSYYDFYQVNTFSISTNTISFKQTYNALQICNGTTCTATIPPDKTLPEGDTYWWINVWSASFGWLSQPSGNLGYFKVVPASSKDITSFVFEAVDNPQLPADVTGTIAVNTVRLLVPFGTNLSALVPTITTIVGSSINPPSGSAQAFTDNVSEIYTVTAVDRSTKHYAVTVTVAPDPTAKDITSFVLSAANNPELPADITGTVDTNTVDLTVPYGTSISALVPTITITGSSVNPASAVAQAFTDGVGKIYAVTAADNSTKEYTVTVTVARNPAKDITSFVFRAANNPGLSSDVTGTVGANTVDLTVPYGTDLYALVPTIGITGSSVNPGSGVAQAFTDGIGTSYTVTAANNTSKGYTVTVHVALNPAKDIDSFVFRTANNPALTSDVTGTIGTNTVDLTVPYGTNLSALVPTITITGDSVNPASGAAQSFTDGVGKTYTVTAANSTTKGYTVTVHVALNPTKDITSFIFTAAYNSGLTSDVTGTVGTNTVNLTVPYGTNLSALVPTITITGSSVNPASGVAQAFTLGVGKTYTVTAADSSTKNYTVTVTVALNPAKNITAFSFTSSANPGKLIDTKIGTIIGTNISVTVPPLTDVTGLVATFSITGTSVKVGSTLQTSGTTANNFTNPVIYSVMAADGSTEDYTVTVQVETEAPWEQETNSGIRSWYAIAASADGMKLAAAAYNNYIYTSTNGGLTWTAKTNSGQRGWYSLTSSADGMRLAAGVNSGYIYTSTDGGATWTERTNAGSHAWYSIASSADGMKLAACDYNTGYIYTSINGGATWTQRTTSGQRLWSSIASSADGMKLAACVQNGYLYTSSDGGATWTANTSMGAQFWWSITSSADGQKLAVIAYNGNLCTSHNGGATWTNLGNRGWCAISSSADGTRLAAVVDGGYIYLSTDSGVTWVQQTSAGIRSWDTVAVSGDGSMAAVGDYGNYNGGYIWIGQFPAIETPPVQAASFSVNHASISISDNGTAKSYIMTRTDITNEVGGFNGGGRGNKNILGITGYSGLPLSEFASVSFATNAMGTGNNIYLNMIIDLDGDVTTVGDRKILTASDASGNFPGDIVTAHVGGGASAAGNVQNYPAGQYDLRSYLPEKTIWGAVGLLRLDHDGLAEHRLADPGAGGCQ